LRQNLPPPPPQTLDKQSKAMAHKHVFSYERRLMWVALFPKLKNETEGMFWNRVWTKANQKWYSTELKKTTSTVLMKHWRN
jgi:hypothetical protein